MIQYLLLFQEIDTFQKSAVVVIAGSQEMAEEMGKAISNELNSTLVDCKKLGAINFTRER